MSLVFVLPKRTYRNIAQPVRKELQILGTDTGQTQRLCLGRAAVSNHTKQHSFMIVDTSASPTMAGQSLYTSVA